MIDLLTFGFYAGIAGAIFLIAAWASEAIRSVEKHKSLIDLKFTLIYVVAISFLLTHSIAINDPIFIFLNATTVTLATFEILYTIYLQKVKRKPTLKNRKGN
jgi:predicted tellurium resistance membrane protein TerC